MQNKLNSDSIFNDEYDIEDFSLSTNYWKVIIADDDEYVHSSTKIVLNDLVFENKKIKFLSAYSAADLTDILKENPDTAVILLDVVMESPSAGLDVIKVIRNEQLYHNIRIILRTGQPGEAPEKKVVIEYDIYDYKEKNELASQKLFTSVYSALRSFRDLQTIEKRRYGVNFILNSSYSLLKVKSDESLAEKSLKQRSDFSRLFNPQNYCRDSLAVLKMNGGYEIIASKGSYSSLKSINELDNKIISNIEKSLKSEDLFTSRNISYSSFSPSPEKQIIFIENYSPAAHDENQLYKLYNDKIGIVFENLFLNNDINNTQIELINILSDLIENRSHETAFHVTRVSRTVKLLMNKMKFSEEDIDIYSHAAPLHDIGKIGIKDSILLKPGPLEEDEFNIIKTHTNIGHKILSGSNRTLFNKAAVIALQHHEKWDGSGYPKQLKGDKIDQVARIVSLSDVFDALSNDRIYKKAWKLDKILNYIRTEREKSFDPAVVDIFLDSLESIIEIQELYKG